MATAESSDQGMIASDMRYLGAGNTVVDDDSDPRNDAKARGGSKVG